jgi:hypothetical protein
VRPAVDQYRVFSGVAPLGLGFEAHTALVHADAGTPDVAELIDEMAARTDTGYLFGGLASSRATACSLRSAATATIKGHGAASGVFSGGLSGVAFGAGVHLVSRVTQGASPVAPVRTITQVDGSVLLQLDGARRWTCCWPTWASPSTSPRARACLAGRDRHAVRATLVGLSEPGSDAVGRTGNFGSDVLVRHIIGLDPARRGVAIAEPVEPGMRLAFCQRNVQAARADLTRICAEIREELESEDTALEAAGARALPGAEPEPHPARAWPAPSTSAAPAAAARTSAAPVPSCRSCAGRWATSRWWASSPAARSPAPPVRLHRGAHSARSLTGSNSSVGSKNTASAP